MSYLSANAGSGGWLTHERAVVYDQYVFPSFGIIACTHAGSNKFYSHHKAPSHVFYNAYPGANTFSMATQRKDKND
jgi:hypothetical protein